MDVLNLEETLRQVRARRLILLEHGVLWAPNMYVPRAVRCAIKTHRRQLLALIATSDSTVCPAPHYHRKYWRRYGPGAYTCLVCHRIREHELRRRQLRRAG